VRSEAAAVLLCVRAHEEADSIIDQTRQQILKGVRKSKAKLSGTMTKEQLTFALKACKDQHAAGQLSETVRRPLRPFRRPF
jgi:cytochrome c556